jgi:hypothetical protein
MRASMWLAALALSLALGGAASAATFSGYGGIPPAGMSTTPPQGAPGLGLGTYLRNTFSFRSIFAPFQFQSRVNVPTGSVIPDPNSPDYLKAFGYRRLGR